MANTEDRKLAIDVIARVDKLEKAMGRAKQVTSRSMGDIENRVKQFQTRVNASFKGAALGFGAGILGGFSADAALKLVDASTKISNALKVTGLAGADLTKVYDALFASAQRQAAPLATLVELYSRAALQQKELGVSTEQLLQFTDNVALALRVQGADAATASGSLLQLAQALGSGVVHAQEFNSILEGTPTIAQAVAAGLKDVNGSVAQLRTLVVNGKVSSAAFFAAFEAGADTLRDRVAGAELTVSQAFTRLQNVMIDVAGKFNDSTAAGTALANFLSGPLTQAVQEIGSVFSGVANGPIGQFVGLIDEAVDSLLKASEAFGKATGLSKIGESLGAKSYSQVTNPPLDVTVSKPVRPTKPISLADYPVGPSKGTGSGGARKNSYERETASLEARIASINALAEAQAKLNPLIDDYGQAVETARAKQELINAAQAAGVKITPALQAQIDMLAAKYGEATAASQKLADAQDKVRQSAEDSMSAARDFASTFIDDMIDGKSAVESLGDALKGLGKQFANLALTNLFGGGSGGGFGAIGALLGLNHYASGTNSAPGGVALVGERGPELVNLPRGAQVIPSPQTMGMLRAPQIPTIAPRASATPSRIPIEIHVRSDIDASGNIVPTIMAVSSGVADVRIAHYDKMLPGKVAHYSKRPRER